MRLCGDISAMPSFRSSLEAVCDPRRRPWPLTRETMTDEQRKSVALEYLKAFDNGGVTSTGDGILDLFADDAQVYFPKWGLATGKEEIGRLFGDVGATIKQIEHHYSHFNRALARNPGPSGLGGIASGVSRCVSAAGWGWC